MSKAEALRELAAAGATQSEAAARLNVSRQRVHDLAKRHAIGFQRKPRKARVRRPPARIPGKCLDCPAPAENGRDRCEKCRLIRASRDTVTAISRKADGLCPRCGGDREDERWVQCESCREAGRRRYAAYRKRHAA
ncbi:MAG: hypothetical protein OXC31_05130 [Spirochaetaceae bacterium]|nr:hypothetical protein [Spirochaetaceae bacterium]